MPLRNLPTDVATSLAQMIDIRPGQVSSMALTRNAGFDLTWWRARHALCCRKAALCLRLVRCCVSPRMLNMPWKMRAAKASSCCS